MKKHVMTAGIALVMPASVMSAQANTCPGGGQSPTTIAGGQANAIRDACMQAVDVFQFIAPQLGLALAGGNATLGQGGTLGGLGHFALGVRANAFRGDLPDVGNYPAPRITQTQAPLALPSDKQPLGLPVVDAAFGLFKGFPLGVTSVGGVDLLLSASYVPSYDQEQVKIEPETNLKLGFGGRLGVLEESSLVPGVAVTYIRRDVPTTTISGTSSNLDFRLEKTSIKTSAWRVVASKSLIFFGLAAGYGQDRYEQSTTVSGTAKNIPTPGGATSQIFAPVTLSQDLTRTNMFVDLSMNLVLFKLVGEVGRVTGADPAIPSFNSFTSGKSGDTRTYASVGLRFGR